MARYEKHAWLNLAVIAVTLMSFGSLFAMFGLRPASAAFGLLGIWGLGPILFFIKRRPNEVITDERDEVIKKTASQQAFAVFWLFFVASCMIIWMVNFESGFVSVDAFPLLVVAGWMMFVLIHGASTLVQYRTRTQDADV